MVDEALRVATDENGYTFQGMDAEAIACDLLDYSPEFSECSSDDVQLVSYLVQNWLDRRK
jgi:hypothetical protein